MTYWLLCGSACFATFAIAAVSLNVLRRAMEPLIARCLRRARNSTQANISFLLRMLPVGGAAAVAFGLALPAFLALEPAVTGERVSFALAALACLGFALIAAVLVRAGERASAGRILARQWRSRANRSFASEEGFPVYEIAVPGAVVATVGVFRPAIFVSSTVMNALNAKELAAAVAHETCHVASFDNLKRVLIRAVRVPLVRKSAEPVWTKISELAADERAVATGTSPLDLASALIKVSRLLAAPIPNAAPVSCFLPYETRSMISERVEHLLKLSSQPCAKPRRGRALLFSGSVFAITALVFSQPRILELAHSITEKLVR